MSDYSKNTPARRGSHALFRDPFFSLRNQIEDVFSSFGRDRWPALLGEPEDISSFALNPRTDISENEEALEITVELPGINEKDVSVTLRDGVLVIKGEKKQESEQKKKDFHLTERSYGAFTRSFQLPSNIDEEGIQAAFNKGVMTITAPKSDKLPPSHRKIEIKSH